MTASDAIPVAKIELRSHGPGPLRLVVHGDLEAASVPDFREVASAAVGVRALVIDLTDCTFLDSCGLGALIGVVRRVHGANGRVVISIGPESPVRQLLRHAGLDHLAPVLVHGSHASS